MVPKGNILEKPHRDIIISCELPTNCHTIGLIFYRHLMCSLGIVRVIDFKNISW